MVVARHVPDSPGPAGWSGARRAWVPTEKSSLGGLTRCVSASHPTMDQNVACRSYRWNIPADDIRISYPELAEKRVGFGLSNILVETLYETNRFTFLEEKEQVLKRLVELWELTQDGILVKNPTAPETALQAPDFLVYAEIFDFVPCAPVEKIGLTGKSLTCVTSGGCKGALAAPPRASTFQALRNCLSPEGKYVHTVNVSLFGDARLGFDQSAVGKATLKATQYAVLKALQRLQRAGLQE